MAKNCCTCLTRITSEDAPVLTMGAYGTPKLLCDDCAELIETVTNGREYDAIAEAMDELTKRMSSSNVDDRVTISTVTEILSDGAARAQQIKDGTYDFSLDLKKEAEGFDEIPEELQETEEDRLLDEKDAASEAKFDKFMNWAWAGVGLCVLAVIIYKLIDIFLLK